jgi:hypothetical protein
MNPSPTLDTSLDPLNPPPSFFSVSNGQMETLKSDLARAEAVVGVHQGVPGALAALDLTPELLAELPALNAELESLEQVSRVACDRSAPPPPPFFYSLVFLLPASLLMHLSLSRRRRRRLSLSSFRSSFTPELP